MVVTKSYQTVFWGKMPINFRSGDFRIEEVEEAVNYATRAFPDVVDLIPDFSLLVVGKDAERKESAVVRFGGEDRVRLIRHKGLKGDLKSLLCRVAMRIQLRNRRIRRRRTSDLDDGRALGRTAPENGGGIVHGDLPLL